MPQNSTAAASDVFISTRYIHGISPTALTAEQWRVTAGVRMTHTHGEIFPEKRATVQQRKGKGRRLLPFPFARQKTRKCPRKMP